MTASGVADATTWSAGTAAGHWTPCLSRARTVPRGRENADTKARRLLVEGRLDVEHRLGREIRASVRGDSGEVYSVEHSAGAWSCTCPALTRCSHTRALQLVTVIVHPATGKEVAGEDS